MPRKTNEDFIKQAKEIHPNLIFDKTIYIRNNEKVIVTCSEHGDFEIIPTNLLRGSKCKKCAFIKIAKDRKFTKETFITKSNKVHNYKYNYDNVVYNNNYTNITINCSIHGSFEQTPVTHLKGSGCNLCGIELAKDKQTTTFFDFVIKANKKFDNKFKYCEETWKDLQTPLKIECPIHGHFYQKPRDHIRSVKGCKECNTGVGLGFKKKEFVEHFINKECIFYIIECWNETEIFYKIGITGRTVKERYAGRLPYKYKILKEYTGTAEYVWNLETEYKLALKPYHYKPKIKFNGSTYECFLNIDDIHF